MASGSDLGSLLRVIGTAGGEAAIGDPNAAAAGGVTPLHRAVRNRCSAAVEVLLQSGADPHTANDNGSTARQLAQWTTGRSGVGSAEAIAQQLIIIELLERADP